MAGEARAETLREAAARHRVARERAVGESRALELARAFLFQADMALPACVAELRG